MKCIQLDQNFQLYLGNLPDNVDKDHLHNYNKLNLLQLYLILHIQLYKNNCYRVINIVLCNLEAFKKQKQHYDALVYILSGYENYKSLNVDRDTKKCVQGFCIL
ncbi:unnamed protein product [Paramecium primaurelia]|uniref:Uncharacterized protein n=1 Tax=Paramecium primaurelia TaxID=5886 RepID=A0A8S1MYD0_PARPR|nr:unnamed protein product [Paramecium primaurelia]